MSATRTTTARPAQAQRTPLRPPTQQGKKKDDVLPCADQGCGGSWIRVPADVRKRIFMCPKCGKKNCINCKAIHPGMFCVAYRNSVGIIGTRLGTGIRGNQNRNALPAPAPVPLNISDLGACGGSEEPEVDPKQKQWEATWAQLCAAYNRKSLVSGRPSISSPASTSDYGKVLNQIEKTSLITPTFPFECVICFSDVEPGEGVTLQTCFHSFCRQCVVGSIEFSEAVEFQCPYQEGSESCSAFILDKEVKALCPEHVLDKILKRSITQAEMNMKNSFHCCTANCDAWIEAEDGAGFYRCILCGKVNCIRCKAIHEAMTCADYQSRLKMAEADRLTMESMEAMAAKNQAMKCPQCQIWIIRIEGCDWVICLACRTEICWATKGFRWGPKGKGDISGGCRCMINQVRCVPNCRNCH